jgi:hypothetical protein
MSIDLSGIIPTDEDNEEEDVYNEYELEYNIRVAVNIPIKNKKKITIEQVEGMLSDVLYETDQCYDEVEDGFYINVEDVKGIIKHRDDDIPPPRPPTPPNPPIIRKPTPSMQNQPLSAITDDDEYFDQLHKPSSLPPPDLDNI